MDSVKVWAFSTCVAVVIGSIISMITPGIGKTKIFKAVLSAFILVGIISPLISLIDNNKDLINEIKETEASIIYDSEYQYSQQTLESIEESASVALYPIISDELENFGITDQFGIKLMLSAEKDGIEIESVNISISDLHSIEKEELQNFLCKQTGLDIKIVANESVE